MPLSRLTYFSENQLDLKLGRPLEQLRGIMKASVHNNKKRNITGALIFDDLWFIQALEGDRRDILSLYEKLKDDDRHANVCMAELIDVETRMFGNWWMGLATRDSVTQPVFERYLRRGRLHPNEMQAAQLTDLIRSVAKAGLDRLISGEAA